MIDATPLLRAYARWCGRNLAREDAVASQRHQLAGLLRRARATRFGQAHDFGRLPDVAAFQANVPLRRYEDFWRDWWQPAFPRLHNITWPGTIPYFAATSGTTSGATKYIPVSRAMVRANRRAALDVLVHHLAARPNSRVMAGRNFVLGGSVDLVQQAAGIASGDLSGIAAKEVPWWARSRYFPPRRLALISDWEEKLRVLAPLSLDADIRSISGTASWLPLFFARLAKLRPDLPMRSTSWYPQLELCVHGGVNFTPYRPQFDAVFAGTDVDVREVYPASEGFVAIADRGSGQGLRLLADNGLFFEFVPVEEVEAARPTRHWLGNIECGVNYAVVLSSNAGLWAYLLGDTVRFIDRNPPRLLITGRLAYSLSAFGEHLIGEELEAGIAAAAAVVGRHSGEFAVAAVFPADPGELGRHHFVVETDPPTDDATAGTFVAALDAALARQNNDYREHRTAMHPPLLTAVAPGSFAAWMDMRGKVGGQNKVPRVISNPDLLASLLAFMHKHGHIAGRSR